MAEHWVVGHHVPLHHAPLVEPAGVGHLRLLQRQHPEQQVLRPGECHLWLPGAAFPLVQSRKSLPQTVWCDMLALVPLYMSLHFANTKRLCILVSWQIGRSRASDVYNLAIGC